MSEQIALLASEQITLLSKFPTTALMGIFPSLHCSSFSPQILRLCGGGAADVYGTRELCARVKSGEGRLIRLCGGGAADVYEIKGALRGSKKAEKAG